MSVDATSPCDIAKGSAQPNSRHRDNPLNILILLNSLSESRASVRYRGKVTTSISGTQPLLVCRRCVCRRMPTDQSSPCLPSRIPQLRRPWHREIPSCQNGHDSPRAKPGSVRTRRTSRGQNRKQVLQPLGTAFPTRPTSAALARCRETASKACCRSAFISLTRSKPTHSLNRPSLIPA